MEKTMAKRLLLAALILSVLLLSGCWNYRGLNEISIVIGISVDKDPQSGLFKLCFESVDLSSDAKSGGPKSKLIDSEGKTLFDAVRNAKKRLANKLYFGNTQVVVLSQDVALTEGIENVTGWILRDAECRETVYTIVSQEKTAKDILSTSGIDQAITSMAIDSILSEDASLTASTVTYQLYQVFNILKGQGKSLVLPAFHSVVNNEKPAPEANGIAVFQGDKLAGFLTPEESKYCLFAINGVKGGVLALPEVPGVSSGVTLEISQSNTKRSYAVKDGKLIFRVDVNIRVFLGEAANMIDAEDEQIIKRLEDAAGESVRQKMLEVIHKVQSEYGSDIFGFGEMIYKTDPKLWAQIGDSWNSSWFPQLNVEIACQVDIFNTAFLQKS